MILVAYYKHNKIAYYSILIKMFNQVLHELNVRAIKPPVPSFFSELLLRCFIRFSFKAR